MIPIIMVCSLVCTVVLIGVCAPLPVAVVPNAAPGDDRPFAVIAQPFRDDLQFYAYGEGGGPGEGMGKEPIKEQFRKWIASRSVPILRAQGRTDEEIKSELLRDFALTEEQADEIIAAQ